MPLHTSSKGGRQRYWSKVNSERLCRGPVLEKEPGMVDKREGRELGGKCGLLASFGESYLDCSLIS